MGSGVVSNVYCQCGCGQKTRIATQTDKRHGHIKGQPHRFVKNHHGPNGGSKSGKWKGGRFVNDSGYVLVHKPAHHRADSKGYVREHILVAERALRRRLPDKSQVHHVNGDPADNRPVNLVVCESDAYHKLLHRRQRARDSCGRPSWRKCVFCKQWDDPSEMYVTPKEDAAFHRRCHNKYERQRRAKKRPAYVWMPC